VNVVLVLVTFGQGLRLYLAGFDTKIIAGLGVMLAMALVSLVLQWRMARQSGFIGGRSVKIS
jgi:hypothetical protein